MHPVGRMTALAVLAMTLAASGCATFESRAVRLPPKARVGLLVLDNSGNIAPTGLHAYLTSIVDRAGLVPVAMTDIRMSQVKPVVEAVHVPGGADKPVELDLHLLGSLKPALSQENVQYLLIVHGAVSGLDDTFSAVLVRATDMAIVGTRFTSHRINAPLCIPLTLVFGLSGVVCPWFFFRDLSQETIFADWVMETLQGFEG